MNLEENLKFFVNGVEHQVNIHEVDVDKTLNSFLRSVLHLTGTKRMCLEGGCGACIVAVERKSSVLKKATVQAVNSCLVPLMQCNGWKIETIEGISHSNTDYHFLQKVLTHFNGSQCGFCSPGMVMNMYSLSQDKKITMKEVENSFGGNICRCTGYRPILSAFKAACNDASSDLLQQCPDIEDLKMCQKRRERPHNNNVTCQNPYYFNLGKTTWIKVFLLNDLLQILKTFQNSTYTLVAGNTSIGVYRPSAEAQVYVDITSIDDLTRFKIENDFLVMGANMSLTDAMELFEKLPKRYEKFEYLKKLSKHIDLIANVPVRNLGTLGGNLMMKHYHHDFASDIFLILETVGATLLLVDTEGNESKISVNDLLKTTMIGRVIKNIVLPPLSSNFKYESYKIMPRAQNAHALVNAGFLLELNKNNIVESARIVFGSINPSFVHATKAEQFLVGKQLFDNKTLQETFGILDNELVPNIAPPEPSPNFRKQLAISLFYKYVLSITPKDLISSKNKSGACLLERPLCTGVQDFGTDESSYPVSKPISKIESLAQTSGQAEYIMDMPDLPGQLFGAFVLAKTRPLSIIRKIHTNEAMKVKGVVAFFTKDDIPGQNNFTPKETNSFFLRLKEEIFCSGEVQYFHQPVGLIVATTQEIAEQAANLVEVSYNPSTKQPLLSIKDVLTFNKDKAHLETEIKATRRGNNTEHVVKGSFEMSAQYHYHMETQCCNVVPTEDGLDIYPSSQWLDLTQTAAATTLNIPANKINVVVRRLGGAFGAKISRNSLVSCAAALAAFKLKKPVKIWMPFETNMNVIGKRYPVVCNYEIGVDKGGNIQYVDNTVYSDYGAGGNEPNIPYLLDTYLTTYNTETWQVKAYSTFTNNPASAYTRAPGTCEGLAMVEAMMEHTAMRLNMDGTEFRLKNMDKNKHELLVKLIKELNKWADVDIRKKEINRFNDENRWKKRGLAVVPMVFPFVLFANYGVIVSIYKSDGTVSVAHGGVEMGQGINTKVAQVCAYKLGLPVEKISVKPSNNLISPNAHITGGSVSSETVCYGVIKACDVLLSRIEPIRSQLKNATWEEIVMKCYEEYINLSASSMASPKDVKTYEVCGVCACEIELDVLTGQYLIKRVDLLEDAGTSMNANIDMGQVEGAFVMGMGYFTSEQIVIDENGQLLTNRTWNYKPPGARDIPVDFRIKFPKNTPNNGGVLNAKAVAEPPLCLACSVPLAIRNAVASVRTEANKTCEKWYPFCGPSTVENVFLNCLHNYKHYTL